MSVHARPGARVCAVALLAMAVSAPAAATTIVVQPSNQDAFIRKNAPNRIAGANPTNQRIRVQASPPNTQVWRGLVQFPLAAIPFGSTVNSATADLFAGNNPSNPALTHGLHRITAAWLQSAVKWNNAPPFVAGPTATALVGTGMGFKSFTVTSDVQTAVNLCAADHGWMIKDQSETGSNDQVNYVSLEDIHPSQLLNRPKLTVDFTPPPCSTDADCADTNFCTTNEHCVSGSCVVDPVSCDDGDPCTDDFCDCGSGCINSNICNDGFTCTVDTCDPDTLACTNTPMDSLCNDQCTTGTCLADPDDTVEDPVTGCIDITPVPDDTPCVDADLCTTGDTCTAGVCGGGTPVGCTPLDDCHVAGTCDSGTGLCSNPPAPDAMSCDDGNTCTIDDECTGGTCGGSSMTCGDGAVQPGCNEDCDVPGGGPNCTADCHFICGPAPAVGCRAPAVAQKGTVQLKDKTPDKKDGLNWKYIKGAATTVGDFGTPLTGTNYTLCIWDASAAPQPRLLAHIPSGGTCGTKPCWKAIKDGFKYNDKLLDPDGIQQLLLKAGPATKAKIIAKGKGVNLPMPTLPLTTTVTVQLKNDAGVCWEAKYSVPTKNVADQFKAKAN